MGLIHNPASNQPASHDPVRRAYDRLAESYDRRWASYLNATLDFALDQTPLGEHDRVLDVACGTGLLAARLSAAGAAGPLVGVDLSRGMLAHAQRRWPTHAWLQADALALPLRDAVFDRVYCLSALHFFRDRSRALAEIRRVLRPGGTLVLVDWCRDYRTVRLLDWWLRLRDPAHGPPLSAAEAQALLRRSGLEIRDIRQRRVGWMWGLMRLVAKAPR